MSTSGAGQLVEVVEPPVRALLEAIVDRDPSVLARVLAAEVTMRALVPPRLLEASGVDEAASLAVGWFEHSSALELRDAAAGTVGSRRSLRYRLRVEFGDDAFEVEQAAFLTLGGGLIRAIDLLCSGFEPLPRPAGVLTAEGG